MTTIDTQDRFIELRANNVSFAKIANELGVSKTTLIKWAKEREYDIINQRSYNLDALQEQYKVGKQYRIKMLSERLDTLLEEAKSRDLSELPTHRLFELIDRTIQALEHEEVPFTYSEPQTGFYIDPVTEVSVLKV